MDILSKHHYTTSRNLYIYSTQDANHLNTLKSSSDGNAPCHLLLTLLEGVAVSPWILNNPTGILWDHRGQIIYLDQGTCYFSMSQCTQLKKKSTPNSMHIFPPLSYLICRLLHKILVSLGNQMSWETPLSMSLFLLHICHKTDVNYIIHP